MQRTKGSFTFTFPRPALSPTASSTAIGAAADLGLGSDPATSAAGASGSGMHAFIADALLELPMGVQGARPSASSAPEEAGATSETLATLRLPRGGGPALSLIHI